MYDTLEQIDKAIDELDHDGSDWARRHRTYLRGLKRQVRLRTAREKGSHTPIEWMRLVVEFDGRCVKCFADMQGFVDKDHIVPICIGGADSIDNIQPLCRRCNSAKTLDTTNWVQIRREHGWQFKTEAA